jgi:hypothetical protein
MMEKMGWTDRVKEYFKESRSILHTIKRKKADWIGRRLRRNCLLKHVLEGKTEGTGG